jgi:stage V sporulation protein SpoVS
MERIKKGQKVSDKKNANINSIVPAIAIARGYIVNCLPTNSPG